MDSSKGNAMSKWDMFYNEVAAYYLSLVQWVYGRERLGDGWDSACGETPPVDFRSRLAGWMLLRRNF